MHSRRLIYLGMAAAILYWLLEASLHCFVFRGDGIAACFVPSESHELWMRSVTALMFVATGIIAQYLNNLRVKAETRYQAELLEVFYRHTHDCIALLDKDFNYIRVNQAYAQAVGKDVSFFPGKNHFDIHPSDDIDTFREVVKAGEAYGARAQSFADPEHPEKGATYWDWNLTPISHGGETEFLIFTKQNVTERYRAESDLRQANRALRTISACNSVLVRSTNETTLLNEMCRIIVETGGYVMAWVGMVEHDSGKGVRPIAEYGFEDGYLSSADITWADTERGQGPTGSAIRTGKTVVNQDCLHNPKMAPWREAAIKRGYQSSIALPVIIDKQVLAVLTLYASEPDAFNPGEVELLEEMASDLAYGIEALRTRSAHKEAQEKLDFMAHHDPLTGMPNRILLRDRFELAKVVARRRKLDVGILFLDIDDFQLVNDSLGRTLADQLLLQVVERLQGCIRDTDTISREGGDEFVIMLSGVDGVATIETIAQEIIYAFNEPFTIDHHTLTISVCIGITIYPNDGKDFDTLLRQAETSLQHAKLAGRNIHHFFTEQMNIHALERIQLLEQLRHAMEKKEFSLYYQPQINTVSGEVTGAEALVRWQHPQHGLIPPIKFIPLAERSGLIIPLGAWVLDEACRQAQAWRESHQLPPMLVAINLSAMQFQHGNIVETVASALAHSGLPANHLELELTESILLHDIEVVVDTLHRLKEIGVKLSIDDFGTGYSSFSYLQRLAVDKLKVDQSFVRDMVENPGDAAIVKGIIQLAHTLKLNVIAEGVETDAQLQLLKDLGCDEVQGYLFSPPVPAEDFVGLYGKPKTL